MSEAELELGIKNMQLHHVGENYVLCYGEKNFQVQRFLFETISKMQSHGVAYTLAELESGLNLRVEERQVIRLRIVEQIRSVISAPESKSYIALPFPLLSQKAVGIVTSPLTVLFNRYLVSFVAFIALAVAILFSHSHGFHSLPVVPRLSLWETALTYSSILLILLFHELGHAAAARSCGIRPREIGVGFYFGLPVFFANVSDAWKLEIPKRIIINIGGVYFQAIASVAIYVSTLVASPSAAALLVQVYKINVLIAAYVLIPFIRNDGYWIFSDYFNIPNLTEKSYTAPYRFARKVIRNIDFPGGRPVLVLYSIGHYAFVGYFLYTFAKAAPRILVAAVEILVHKGPVNFLVEDCGLFISATFTMIGSFLLLRALSKRLLLILKAASHNELSR